MSNFSGAAALAALMGVLVYPACGQEPNPFRLSGLHPGYSLTNLLNGSNYGLSIDRVNGQPNVGAMCWLANGDLFVATQAVGASTGNLLGPSNAYVFSGAQGTPSAITMRQVSNGFYEPSGCVEVNGSVYVVDNQSGLVRLTDNGTTAWTKTTVYGGLLAVMTGKTGSGDRRWDAGLLHQNGYFYSSVGMGLIPGGNSETGANQYRGRGTVLRVPLAGGRADTVAGGIRNGGGMGFGPNNEIFLTDNQGGWKPSCPIYNIRQGRWYGHPDTPFGPSGTVSGDVDPPAVIFPYGAGTSGSPASDPALSRSPTDILMLRSGPYAGQLLVGEIFLGGLNRVFLERIGGEYQGVIFPFTQGLGTASAAGTGGFSAPVRSLLLGPDNSTIYLGGGGGEGGGGANWGVANRNHWGLARLSPTNAPVFEMRAIRSLNSTQMEIEFTEAINAAAVSNFTVHHWNYTVGGPSNTGTYGAGKNTPSQLTVTAAAVSTDRMRITLTISGLRELPAGNGRDWPFVVQFQVSGITAVSGRSLWGGQAWYTLVRFGPAEVTPVAGFDRNGLPASLSAHWKDGMLRVSVPGEGDCVLRVLDSRGRVLAIRRGEAAAGFQLPASILKPGLNVLEARSGQGRWRAVVAGAFGK